MVRLSMQTKSTEVISEEQTMRMISNIGLKKVHASIMNTVVQYISDIVMIYFRYTAVPNVRSDGSD